MGSPGRKLARQNKRKSLEGKEQLKQEQADKQASQSQPNLPLSNQNLTGYQPQMRIRQRRAGT